MCGQGWVEEGQSPLHLAALVGTKDVVRPLTEADAPLEALGGVDITLLQHAIRHVNVGAVEALLEGTGGRVRGATIEAAGESNVPCTRRSDVCHVFENDDVIELFKEANAAGSAARLQGAGVEGDNARRDHASSHRG